MDTSTGNLSVVPVVVLSAVQCHAKGKLTLAGMMCVVVALWCYNFQ